MSKVIALLGQPNAGKSTLFNTLTGMHQHVGNWPGKTVEQKEGTFTHDGVEYTVADLPGTYSLSANSDEEIITRDYIASGKADVVCIIADSSQLNRSLYMLADYAGINVPCFLLLNMNDVAKLQGKEADAKDLSAKLGIPVIPFSAPDKKKYDSFYKVLDKALNEKTLLNYSNLLSKYEEIEGFNEIKELIPDHVISGYSKEWLTTKAIEGDEPVIERIEEGLSDADKATFANLVAGIDKGVLKMGERKFAWIDELLGANDSDAEADVSLGKFDRIITHRIWGKPVVVLIILLGLIGSFIPALPIMGLGSLIGKIPEPLSEAAINAGCPSIVATIICGLVIQCFSFVVQMLGFVFGVTLVFGFLEEVGIMARISYVFDNSMAKLGLQGKSVMPFLVSFGCTMGGAAGTRVIDNWGQKVLTIALSWAVPCGATWAVVPMLSTVFFGAWVPVIIAAILLVMVLHMWITAKVFGRALVKQEDRYGMIMELPPYHRPRWGVLLRYVLGRTKDTFFRAFKVVVLVALVFWLLSYSSTGDISQTVLYKVGHFVEPVTKHIGMGWETFMAFIASSLGKEGTLGVLSTVFSEQGDISFGTVMAGTAVSNLNELLVANVPKPEALALVFAITFNMPCIVALAATYQETHSAKWTAIIATYYTVVALIIAGIAYHIGMLIW